MFVLRLKYSKINILKLEFSQCTIQVKIHVSRIEVLVCAIFEQKHTCVPGGPIGPSNPLFPGAPGCPCGPAGPCYHITFFTKLYL